MKVPKHGIPSTRNDLFLIHLGSNVKPGLNIFPYSIDNYEQASERHNPAFEPLPNANASHVKDENFHRTSEPPYKVADKVLVSTKNIDIQQLLLKMIPLWIALFTILSVKYNSNTYRLDFATDLSLNLIYHTFHLSKIKSYVKNNYILFVPDHLAKPKPVSQDSQEVEKVKEYCWAARSKVSQCKVCWLVHSLEHNQWIKVKEISNGILQEL